MKMQVRLRMRPSRDGRSFTYYIDYFDEDSRRKQITLGHSDRKKAERQRAQKERELSMGTAKPESMRLSEFLKDSIERTRHQVRQSTLREAEMAMADFIDCVGNIDFLKVRHSHGEQFLQYCLDKGNSPATASKKLRHLKRLFQLAKERTQIDDNPLQFVKQPKSAKRKVRIYSDPERLIKAARQYQDENPQIEWELLISMALCTGMRRGELLNTTWRDIDFERKTVEVSPKDEAKDTWQWHIKDTDRRKLPLTDIVITLLAELQSRQPEGHPYVFVPPIRYEHIQKVRQDGKWSVEQGKCPINNFTRMFKSVRLIAGVKEGEFHDLRRTCLTNWLNSGLNEFDVMNLAGHSKFETTRRFYLAVNEDLVERARAAFVDSPKSNFVAHLLRTPSQGQK